jgi:hypothetical protein
MWRRATTGVLVGETHLARVDLLAAEGVVVGTHVGGVGGDLWLVVVLELAALVICRGCGTDCVSGRTISRAWRPAIHHQHQVKCDTNTNTNTV